MATATGACEPDDGYLGDKAATLDGQAQFESGKHCISSRRRQSSAFLTTVTETTAGALGWMMDCFKRLLSVVLALRDSTQDLLLAVGKTLGLTEHAEYAGPSYTRSPSISSIRSPEVASPSFGSRSPDLISPNFPNRAIRPLPKSKLKSRLSPEQVSHIVYPPDPSPISPTLSFTVQENGTPNQQRRLTNGDSHHHHDHDVVHHHCTCGEDGDSGDDEVEFDHPDYRYPPVPTANGTAVKPVDSLQRRLIEASRTSNKPPPPGSTASSADGYESFENTSNKKKRKIPLSGTSSMHQTQLSAELASLGIGSSGDAVAEEHAINGVTDSEHQQYNSHASGAASGTGISGAGRGRYGRQEGKIRRPMPNGTSNGVNGYNSRAPARAGEARHGSDPGPEHTGGIISQAIKTAAEQGPLTPAGNSRDNTSLLQSATSASNSATPKTQFTFTCESDSANKMVDHHVTQYPAGTPTSARNNQSPGKSTHGTQTTPTLPGRQQHPNVARPPPPPSNAPSAHQQQQGPPPKPKPRRNPAKEYALQAANRKKQQQYQNFHHRPKREDMWICEFCEYEDIYGVPPYAMIRRYEIKDRQERKKAAEKKRLLEKAKMKGRKNKKGAGKGKNNNGNNATAAPAPPNPQNYDPNLQPPEGEEYFDDEDGYPEDDYDPVGDEHYDQGYYPPPAPAGTPAIPVHGVGGRASSV